MNRLPMPSQKGSSVELLPHQTAFVDTVLSPKSNRLVVLRGASGLGKGTALVALAARLARERPEARTLLVAPKILGEQFRQRLQDAGAKGVLVDRYKFREMLDSTYETEIWPHGVVSVLSPDFVKQADIAKSLGDVWWDLVIADEVHQLKGIRADAFKRVTMSAERIVLASSSPFDLATSDLFPGEDATFVEWQGDRLVDHDGTPLFGAPRPNLHEVRFSLSPGELRLRESVGHLCDVIKKYGDPDGVIVEAIARSLESSPPALENTLRRLTDRSTSTAGPPSALDFMDDEPFADLAGPQLGTDFADELVGLSGPLLGQVEQIPADSKLNALEALLSDLLGDLPKDRHVCIVTEYLATLFYIAADIEGRGNVSSILYSGMSAEDRKGTLASFAQSGGSLVTTMATLSQDIDLGTVTDLVLYDIPKGVSGVTLALAPLNRVGRSGPVDVHVLTPPIGAGDWASESLHLLRKALD